MSKDLFFHKLWSPEGNVDEKTRFAGRQAGKRAGLTGAALEKLRRAAEQEAEQTGKTIALAQRQKYWTRQIL